MEIIPIPTFSFLAPRRLVTLRRQSKVSRFHFGCEQFASLRLRESLRKQRKLFATLASLQTCCSLLASLCCSRSWAFLANSWSHSPTSRAQPAADDDRGKILVTYTEPRELKGFYDQGSLSLIIILILFFFP